MLRKFKRGAQVAVATVALAAGVAVPAVVAEASGSPAAPVLLHVTEHYAGRTFSLMPGDWHGATECAIVAPTQAYCFDSNSAFAAFTSEP
jgi:hypothetical protein